MKRNYFYHPLVKGLCLVLCFTSILAFAFCGLRCLYLDSNGAMDASPQFSPDVETYSSSDRFYWPQDYSWEYFLSTTPEYNYYYGSMGDILSAYVQDLILSDEFQSALADTDNGNTNFSLPLVTEGEGDAVITYPECAYDTLISFLRAHSADTVNFRFRISLVPAGYGAEPVLLLSNVPQTFDFAEDLITLASGVREAVLGEQGTDTGMHIRIEYGLPRNQSIHDVYMECFNRWRIDCTSWEMWMLATAGSAVFAIIFLVCVLAQSGMRYRTPGMVHLSRLDRLPAEITLGVKIFAGFFLIMLCSESFWWNSDRMKPIRLLFGYESGNLRDWLIPLVTFSSAALLVMDGMWVLCELVRRFRGGKWWHNTIVWRVLQLCFRVVRHCAGLLKTVLENMPILWRWLCGCALFGLWTLFVIFVNGLVVLWFLTALALGILGCFWIIQLDRVRHGAEKIASGEISHQIETAKMVGAPRALAESLNRIGGATQIAVEERMKSERFRSELITNVSHDLKTPLTSIINYTDLLSKEECENETMKGYIEVLCRQSNRLKKLTDDLLEASKASSGSLAVNLAPTDAAELLTQAVGEYEERFSKCNLHPVVEIRHQPLMIQADGRHLWRVFDNLLSNICKYSMPGTRVYLTAQSVNGEVQMIFRNISANPINVSADELTERFVRGDASRHTEGSGLGLAIADSLTNLQSGTMTLTVDGDLFKAVVAFGELKD